MGANCCSETNDKPMPKKNDEYEYKIDSID